MIGLFVRLLNDAVEAGMRLFQALVFGILGAPFRAREAPEEEAEEPAQIEDP